ncbi:hypothetical protein SOVF_053200 [Spinacia oleracea]|uniref:Uncharacterized protein n=1 Tax=Spinacia oleracea TaxID=3562 RepID=A0A9R0JCJ6_SPIOL|nr:uncharacterized protein LOC110804065 [Spinacia oleracea]KNA20364.1 hypothetical protein SOVF_053200 [Spinacia oleracea]
MPMKPTTTMSSEAMQPNPPSNEGEKHKQLDHEIREMVSSLTSRLNDLHQSHKPGGSGPHMGDEDENGVRIITIAGTNTGATMKRELLDHHHKHHHHHHHHEVFPDDDQPEGLDTYVNSNSQAVNNSIMLGASYTSNDPGVHMDITDVVDTHGRKVEKHGRRGIRKGKEPAQANLQSEFSE